MIIDCISDLHGCRPPMPGGDLLIVAGDMTGHGEIKEWKAFYEWIERQDYKKKVYIGGNHDNFLVDCATSQQAKDIGVFEEAAEYLCDSGTEFCGLKIWGAPWTQWFRGVNPVCKAFMLQSEEDLKKHWDLIPEDTDILITHSPPKGILDIIRDGSCRAGSSTLADWVFRWKPKLHVFGHLHESYGMWRSDNEKYEPTIFVNAAHMTVDYKPDHEPIRVIL